MVLYEDAMKKCFYLTYNFIDACAQFVHKRKYKCAIAEATVMCCTSETSYVTQTQTNVFFLFFYLFLLIFSRRIFSIPVPSAFYIECFPSILILSITVNKLFR